MTKSNGSSLKRHAAKNREKSNAPGPYKVVGTTSDGVKILRAKVGPTHFTRQEIRDTIAQVIGRSSRRGNAKD